MLAPPVNLITPTVVYPVPEIVTGSGTSIPFEIESVAPLDTVVALNVSPFLPRALA